MKRIYDLGEYAFIFLVGYIIFNFVITITQIIMYNLLGIILSFNSAYVNNFKELYVIYISIYIICVTINYIYNLYFINKLNKSLKVVKGR